MGEEKAGDSPVPPLCLFKNHLSSITDSEYDESFIDIT